jgi:hypothetical protein
MIGRFLLALPAAAAVSIMAALLMVQLTAVMPFWLGEAIAAAVAGAVWMIVFARLGPVPFAGSVVSFLCGTGVAWLLSRGIVHSVSPYFGLVSVLAAISGAGIAWLAVAQERATVGGLVPATLLVATCLALGPPALGVQRTLTDAGQQSRRVHVHFVRDTTYLWSAARLDPTTPVGVELDPGSGGGRYRLTPVTATTRALVCERFQAAARSLIGDEVAGGHIPRFITALPFRLADCNAGEIWELRAWQ